MTRNLTYAGVIVALFFMAAYAGSNDKASVCDGATGGTYSDGNGVVSKC